MEALAYQIEMLNANKPPVEALGGRIIENPDELRNRNISGIFEGETDDGTISGHINRNIRLLIANLQGINPTIEVLGFSRGNLGTYDGTGGIKAGEVRIYWRVVGCADKVAGHGFRLDLDERYIYKADKSEQILCFQEGD